MLRGMGAHREPCGGRNRSADETGAPWLFSRLIAAAAGRLAERLDLRGRLSCRCLSCSAVSCIHPLHDQVPNLSNLRAVAAAADLP